MKHILLTTLLLMAFGQVSVNAQNNGRVKDDIYYTAEDAKKDAEEAEKQRQAIEEARRKRAAEQPASTNTYTSSGDNYDEGSQDEYIDYDDDNYEYANRFNRFNNPYYVGSYWAYDPFWGPGWGMGMGWNSGWGMGWGPSWGVGFGGGFGGPYYSSFWGYNSWYGYPGFYNAWGSPYMGYGNWGYGGGYYNGFYDGYYAGAYNNGGGNYRTSTYGPRSSINRYPGSIRSSSGSRTNSTGQMQGGNRGQLRQSNGNQPQPGSINRNYNGRYTPPAEAGNRAVERGSNNGNNNNAGEYRNTPSRTQPARQYNSGEQRTYQRTQPAQQQQAQPAPSYQRSEPVQRSQPTYQSTPSRSYSAPSSPSPSRGGGSFGGGSRGGGGRGR